MCRLKVHTKSMEPIVTCIKFVMKIRLANRKGQHRNNPFPSHKINFDKNHR